MSKVILVILALSACLLLLLQPCWAQRAYVENTSQINLREGPGTNYKIVAMMDVYEPVEILESTNGWSRVRLVHSKRKGEEGWMLTRFLARQVPWKQQAETLKAENDQLKEKLARMEQELLKANAERAEYSQDLDRNVRLLKDIQEKHEILKQDASNVLSLRREYEAAQEHLAGLQETAEKLHKENLDLRSGQRNKWFLTGAAVLLLGLVMGLVLGRHQRKRKASYF